MSLRDKPIILIWEQVDPEMREFMWKVIRDGKRPGMAFALTPLISLEELTVSAVIVRASWLAGEANTRRANQLMAQLLRWLENWEMQYEEGPNPP